MTVHPESVEELVELREAVLQDAKRTDSDVLLLGTIIISCTILLEQKLNNLIRAVEGYSSNEMEEEI
ncbi:hypothetical protein KAR91_22955 [Candidatus Pacearchaeota archaeon]|nr:hypothetical protein [Candidatus Pacearchaeota archaeon]